MPSEVMDQKGGSASSHCFEERQIGFWKTNVMSDHQASTDGMFPMSGSKLVASSPMEKLSPIGFPSMEWMEIQQSTLARDNMKIPVIGGKEVNSLSESSWDSVNHQSKSWSNLGMQPASYGLSGNRTVMNGIQSESSLFSSSLSDVFSKKLRLVGNDALSHQPFNVVDSHLREEEPIESLKDIEALTIGNLLPDEEDLLSGVLDVLGDNGHTDNGDELEDFDLFSSGGGMELEGDDRLWMGRKSSDIANGSIVGEHPYGELPSRTLFVRNINSNVEDSELKALFGHYGDIRTIYTACKHRGFVMISYYDIRAARNALRALQNKPLRRRKLDIHYSIPKDNPSEKDASQGTLVIVNVDHSVSTEELRQIFGVYGEIKEIRENPQKRGHKFIEFYDTRAAEAALHALNRSDITGKQIKLEPSRLGGMRRFFQLSDQEQDEPNICPSPFDNLSSGHMAVSPGVIGSSSMDNGSIHTLHSAIRPPVPAFTEPHQSPIIANNLPSLARLTSNGKLFPFNESNHSLDEVKFGNQHASFHPHSLPEYHDGLMEGLENRHVRGVGSNGHLREPSAGVFGSPGNGNYSLHGNHYMWTNSNSHQQSPSNGVWPNSPSYLNGLHPHQIPQMSGFPRVPPLVLNTASPVHHHIGSAPAVNPSLWERQRNFADGSPETSNFHLGSLGNVGFPGRSPSHPMDIASRNMFSPVGGIDMAKNIGIQSPQQMCHLFPGRNPMMSMPGSFDSPNDRARNLSYRRNELGSNNADKKQYELDLDRILRGEDSRTTLMIKNIPNKYTSKMLLAAIDEHCRGTYDFIYLPIDFKNKCNVGYAFINMIEPRQIIPFYQAFNGKKWEKFNSEKVASLAYARIQGKAALIAHFQNSSLMNEDKRCRPILFHTDGPNAGDPEPFPMGTNIRSRPGKSRNSSGSEENQRPVNTLGGLNGEESSNGSDSSGSLKESEALTK